MSGSLWTFIGVIIAFLVGLFFTRKGSQQDAEVADLTAKIKENTDKLKDQQKDADEKTRDYLDALKKYDPTGFHDDDDSGHSTQ